MKSPLILTIAAATLTLSACNGKPGDAPAADRQAASATGKAMGADATTNIAAGIKGAPTLTSLASAINAAGLAEMLSGAGPFTMFAPSDAAFVQVAPVTRDGWMRPAQKDVLAGVLKYHVVSGALTAADLAAKVAEGGGKAVLKTVDGQDLTATKSGDRILLTSASGNKATVTAADIGQSNGVIHVIDAVLIPQM
ncbi:fasciclin domain-containing protein [Sphingopyxis sp. JAI128]|uniref:fasciclin domain-containing protein n=1 Tax=Sphingopyxis sp. JAI128 TaxID=2723066 RepID=UPI00161A0EE7|nr:fasciclin domain-containing protein [Sphingopyxis sp. JAI128]MBB6424685.1 putative surface protein with fasciclin (FAS1) repeats [Sphingopyxis sp. JAI128]